jgi:hypothetical protein
MSREEFIQGYLERLTEEDSDIKRHFARASNEERERLTDTLRYSLGKSYDTYAKDYFDSKGLGSYVSTFLRGTGAAADAVGTYMFWTLGGAGFGFKGVGLLEKTIADAIDDAHYIKHAKTDSLAERIKDQAKITGEALAERAAAYLPLGIGEIADLLRGRNKYDAKVTERALSHAKQNFFDYVTRPEEKLKILELSKFKNPDYALEQKLSTAA